MSWRAMDSVATSMTVDPNQIAVLLREIAAYLWLEGESFRAADRICRRIDAARVVRRIDER